ncbi:alpha/beta hydrolase [Sphaerimonospora cavernae]|uniref:Alpha/beta hydrolase n=1 Tax=Sphaerimonospora cavernae TaxID=1740611 RepID=A0ABV6U513_9ACTN
MSYRGLSLLLSLTLAGLTGCGSGKPVRVSPESALRDQCGSVPSGVRRVILRARDGVRLGAAALGPADARVGVVLVHGLNQSLCDWLEEIGEVVEETHAQVVIPDRRGTGSSEGAPNMTRYVEDTIDALHWLKSGGAVRFAVMGTSYGAPIALAAGKKAGSENIPICAAVAISPLQAISDRSGSVDPMVAKEPLPKTWIATEEGNTDIASNAKEIFSHVNTRNRGELLFVPGKDHSTGLVKNHPEAGRLIKDAILSCSP